jgi:putative transposase
MQLASCRCFTPVRSPESNGIAEGFVKSFKRDYVRLNPRPDAATEHEVETLIASWARLRPWRWWCWAFSARR